MTKMKYVQAPNKYSGKEKSIFLAGGITGCPDWQTIAFIRSRI